VHALRVAGAAEDAGEGEHIDRDRAVAVFSGTGIDLFDLEIDDEGSGVPELRVGSDHSGGIAAGAGDVGDEGVTT